MCAEISRGAKRASSSLAGVVEDRGTDGEGGKNKRRVRRREKERGRNRANTRGREREKEVARENCQEYPRADDPWHTVVYILDIITQRPTCTHAILVYACWCVLHRVKRTAEYVIFSVVLLCFVHVGVYSRFPGKFQGEFSISLDDVWRRGWLVFLPFKGNFILLCFSSLSYRTVCKAWKVARFKRKYFVT